MGILMPMDSNSVGCLRHERMHKSIMTNASVALSIDIGYGAYRDDFVLWAQKICLHIQSFFIIETFRVFEIFPCGAGGAISGALFHTMVTKDLMTKATNISRAIVSTYLSHYTISSPQYVSSTKVSHHRKNGIKYLVEVSHKIRKTFTIPCEDFT